MENQKYRQCFINDSKCEAVLGIPWLVSGVTAPEDVHVLISRTNEHVRLHDTEEIRLQVEFRVLII